MMAGRRRLCQNIRIMGRRIIQRKRRRMECCQRLQGIQTCRILWRHIRKLFTIKNFPMISTWASRVEGPRDCKKHSHFALFCIFHTLWHLIYLVRNQITIKASRLFDSWMLLRYFLEKVQLVLHGGQDQIILTFLIVLRFLLDVATRSLRCLRPLVILLVIMLDLSIILSFAHLCSFEVS